MTLEEFAAHVQWMVGSTARTFTRPDDDWVPVLLVQTPDEQIAPVVLAFDEASKDRAEAYVKEQIRSSGAVRYAVLTSAWFASSKNQREGVPIRDLPGAYEMLVLTVGDAETETTWGARIDRHPRKPPTLAPWRKMPYEGRFTGLAEAMREVRP